MCDKSPLTLFDGVYIHPESYGCVLVIGAWNFPLLLTLAPVLPALAAGNAVIMKPSEISPATARALQDLIPKYLDDRCVKVQRNCNPLFKIYCYCAGCLWRSARNYRALKGKI